MKVNVCAVPYEMSVVEGGVLFSNKSGFYGFTGRFMWEYKSHLWYLVATETTFGRVAACHLTRMHELLCKHVGKDHTEFELTIKEAKEPQ